MSEKSLCIDTTIVHGSAMLHGPGYFVVVDTTNAGTGYGPIVQQKIFPGKENL